MCGTVALFREAQCGALHHLGYRTVSVFLQGTQQDWRNGVHPGSFAMGLNSSFQLVIALETRERGLVEGDDASFLAFFLSISLEIRQRGLVEGDYASFLSFYRFGNKAAGGLVEGDYASFFLSFYRFGNKAAGAGGGRRRFVLSFYRFGNKAAGAGGGRVRFVSFFLSFFLSLWK